MKKKRAPKHSNDIHLFIINGVLVAALIGAALWLQKKDLDVQLITPTTPTNIEATNTTTPSRSDVTYVSTATIPIQKPITPTATTRRRRRTDDD